MKKMAFKGSEQGRPIYARRTCGADQPEVGLHVSGDYAGYRFTP